MAKVSNGLLRSQKNANAVILTKVRYGDRDVEVSIPHVAKYKDFVPVLVDDIISTGRTMIETIGHLNNAGMKPLFVLAYMPCLKTPFRN
jgi:phosphoribosylpyrophosphate synthetase